MFGRRRVRARPDTALLEQAARGDEVPLGTYEEAVLAVTGADALDAVWRAEGSPPCFADLDDQTRQAAMQAALDMLIASGTVSLPAGTRVKAALAAAKAGKLPVSGPLGDLCPLISVLRRFRSAMMVNLAAPGGCTAADMPPGVQPPGPEFGYWVPFSASMPVVLLVVRPDIAAGTHSFTLRTLRAEINRVADFLFCDALAGGVLTPRQPLHADLDMLFRFNGGYLHGYDRLTRSRGDDLVAATIGSVGMTAFNNMVKDSPKDKRFTRDQLVNVLIRQFVATTEKTLAAGAPPKIRNERKRKMAR